MTDEYKDSTGRFGPVYNLVQLRAYLVRLGEEFICVKSMIDEMGATAEHISCPHCQALATIDKHLKDLKWFQQTVHRAYHKEEDSGWENCMKNSCDYLRQVYEGKDGP